MIDKEKVENIIMDMFKEGITTMPKDIKKCLKESEEIETSELCKNTLNAINKNIAIAENKGIPVCQDTGVPIFYLKIGKNIKSDEIMEVVECIKNAVKKSTEEVPLRPNVVHPITRENFKVNVGLGVPFVHFDFSEDLDRQIEITLFPKGAGSENMSALKMLTPSDGLDGIRKFILETVALSGGKPCPPIIVGIGIGGTSDICMKLSKKALLRPFGKRHPDEKISKLEKELLKDINSLGIGSMGLGGDITAMDVFIEVAGCHTASLPVSVCIQCWAHRKSVRVIDLNKSIK